MPTLLLVPPDVCPPTVDLPKRLVEAVGWRRAPLAWPRLFTGVFPFTVRQEDRA